MNTATNSAGAQTCGNVAPWKRAGIFFDCLEFAILGAAVISVVTGQSWSWIDLRFAGLAAQWWLPAVWVVSLFVLQGITRTTATDVSRISAGALRKRGHIATWLLVPSLAIAAVLLVNTVYFYHLLQQPDFDPSDRIPMCLYVLVVLLRWLAARPDRILRVPRKAPFPAVPRSPHWRMSSTGTVVMVFRVLWTLLMLYIFFFACHADPPPAGIHVDVGVVFGNNTLPGDKCGRALRYRTMEAIGLYHQGTIAHIILSGAAPMGKNNPHKNEPWAMLHLCLKRGVPRQAIVLDFHGNNTRYSCYNAARIMRQHHWKTVVGISSDYHLPRIKLAFVQNHMDAWTVAGHPVRWRQTSLFALVRELVGYPVYMLDPHYHAPHGARNDEEHS